MLKVVLNLVNITGASLRDPRLFESLLLAVRILAAVADTSHAVEPSPGDDRRVLGAVRPVPKDGVRILLLVVVEVDPFFYLLLLLLRSIVALMTTHHYSSAHSYYPLCYKYYY